VLIRFDHQLLVEARLWRYEFGFGAPGSGKPPEYTTEMDYVYHALPASLPPGLASGAALLGQSHSQW